MISDRTGKLLAILGPTATGKTDLALNLAEKFNGELVSCDSRQVYKDLDIGTGKYPSKKYKIEKRNGFWEIGSNRVWMYDVVNLKKQYTVANYVRDANKIIEDIYKRDKLPIIIGGTGFYFKALLKGLPNLSIPIDIKLRKKLQKLSKDELQKKLQEISAERWKALNQSDRQNPRRLVRAIELSLVKPKIQKKLDKQKTNALKIGLTARRNILYKKADEGVIKRINSGMVEEARKLQSMGLGLQRMRRLGLEYGILADFLEDKIKTKEDLIKIMQGEIHGFIRRQLTWFKRDIEINWFDINMSDYQARIEKLILDWYNLKDASTKN